VSTRREFLQSVGGAVVSGGLARKALLGLVAGSGATLLARPSPVRAGVLLDTFNPLANFTVDPPGSTKFTPGPSLTLTDNNSADFITFIGADPDAAPNIELDLAASFRITSTTPSGVDTGVRFIINDGVSKAAIAACIVKGGVRGIGLAAGIHFDQDDNYPANAFVPVNWTAPTTLRLRRTADNKAELIEVNGAPPPTPAIVDDFPQRYRDIACIEFGCANSDAIVTLGVDSLRSFRPGPTYTFGGFLPPVDPLPALNSMKAGAAVPVKFSLGGDQGLAIFAAAYPRSQAIACDSTASVDGIEQTVAAGGSSLQYDALTDVYTYVWKTGQGVGGHLSPAGAGPGRRHLPARQLHVQVEPPSRPRQGRIRRGSAPGLGLQHGRPGVQQDLRVHGAIIART